MKTPEKTNSTSTPSNGAPDGHPVIETAGRVNSLLAYPRISEPSPAELVQYGTTKVRLPIGRDTGKKSGKVVYGSIDGFFFSNPKTLRLKKIKPVLASLTKLGIKQSNGDAVDSKWFNTNVRDVFHKAMKFAAREALAHGVPVSLQLSNRTEKNGDKVLTSKHGFEYRQENPDKKQLEETASKKSKGTAKRQSRKNRIKNPVLNTATATIAIERIVPVGNVETPKA